MLLSCLLYCRGCNSNHRICLVLKYLVFRSKPSCFNTIGRFKDFVLVYEHIEVPNLILVRLFIIQLNGAEVFF